MVRHWTFSSFTALCFFGLAIAALPAAESPAAKTDLICPTANDADCYPRLFQPTEEFQIIKPDQDIPPGLHVRMNIWSGEREARLNIPMEGEANNPDLPDVHDSGVIVVDQPENEEDDSPPAMRDRVTQKPPVYEAAGKIQPPPPTGADVGSFASAVAALVTETTSSYEDALAILDDLSHDIYYGVELVKSPDAIHTLFTLMHTSDDPGHKKQAANILGHAVQNNPTALKELLDSWEKTSIAQPMGEALYHVLKSHSHANSAGIAKAKIYALNGIIKDSAVRNSWLKEGGMNVLLDLLSTTPSETPEEAKMIVKLVDFVMDNFLDGDMGAEKGVFPEQVPPQLLDACDESVGRRGMNGRCWERVLASRLRVKSVTDRVTREGLERFQELLDGAMGASGKVHKEL